MILEARRVTPFIHFGFNSMSRVGYIGEVVDIYLKTIYNQDVYLAFQLAAAGSTLITYISNYHYQVTYDTVGVKTLTTSIEKGNPLELTSNALRLEIKSNSFDSDTIGFDNTELTFDIF